MTPTRNEIRRDDPDGIGAALLDCFEQVDAAVARLAANELGERNRQVAEKRHELAHGEAVAEARVADTLKEGNLRRFAARALGLGHGLREFQKTAETGGQAAAVLRDSARPAPFAQVGDKGNEAAVPTRQLRGVESDATERGSRGKFALDQTGRGHIASQLPLAEETDDQG